MALLQRMTLLITFALFAPGLLADGLPEPVSGEFALQAQLQCMLSPSWFCTDLMKREELEHHDYSKAIIQ